MVSFRVRVLELLVGKLEDAVEKSLKDSRLTELADDETGLDRLMTVSCRGLSWRTARPGIISPPSNVL